MTTDTILDLTGNNPEYLTLNEVVNVPANKIFGLANGVFYTQSVTIRDTLQNRTLVPYVDYIFLQPESTATAKSGLETALYIGIKNPTVSTSLLIQSYQFVGGFYKRYTEYVLPILSDLNLDISELTNLQVIHIPELFPEDHLLRANVSSFGFEFVAWAIEQISQALLIGDEDDHQAIRDQLNALIAQIEAAIPAGIAMVDNHEIDVSNPHETTAAKISAYTQSALLSVLNLYLAINATAADTNLLVNKTYTTVVEELRQNLNVNLINSGYLPYSKMMTGFVSGGGDQILLGSGWTLLSNLQNLNEPIYYFGDTLSAMYTAFGGYPVGTRVTLVRTYVNYVGGAYGNGNFEYKPKARETYVRTSTANDGWTRLHR